MEIMRKIKENEEIKILRALKEKLSYYKISQIFNMDKKRIKNIEKNGKWYIDLGTNELVFTDKKISMDKQAFYYLYYLFENNSMEGIDATKTIHRKNILGRIAIWLADGEETKIKSMVVNCNNWHKEITIKEELENEEKLDKKRKKKKIRKENRLVQYDYEKEKIIKEILELGEEFKKTEMEVFEKSYFYDKETGYPKGFRLCFTDLYKRTDLLYSSLGLIKEYIDFDGAEEEYRLIMLIKIYNEKTENKPVDDDLNISLFEFSKLDNERKKECIKKLKEYKRHENTKPYFYRFKLKIGIEIGKWGKEMLKKGYGIDEIYYRLERRCDYKNITKDRGTIDLNSEIDDVPRVVYTELGAYNDGTINEEMRKKVEETFIL